MVVGLLEHHLEEGKTKGLQNCFKATIAGGSVSDIKGGERDSGER